MDYGIMQYNSVSPYIESQKYFYNGNCVPRVTEILSLMHDDYLMSWCNYLGFKHQKYEEVLDVAANIGTIVHDLCDKIMQGYRNIDYSIYDRSMVKYINNSVNSFIDWWDELNANHKVKIIGIEQELICQYFGGTADIILEIDGNIYLFDMKTSAHIGYKYWGQLAAYTNILFENGYDVKGAAIIRLPKNKRGYEQFTINYCIPEQYKFMQDCYNMFIGAVYTYFNRLNVNQQMSNINFKGGFYYA